MTELFSDLAKQLRRRLSNPLLASFTISWLLWNYKLIAVLLAYRPIEKALVYIDCTLGYSDWCSLYLWQRTIILPSLSALFYVYAIPFLTDHAFNYTIRHRQQQRNKQKELEGMELLTVEDARKLRKEYDEEANRLELENERKQRRIEVLQRRLEELEVNDSNSRKENAARIVEKNNSEEFSLTNSQLRILNAVTSVGANQSVKESDLKSGAEETLVFETDIDRLTNLKLIFSNSGSEGRYFYSTEKGALDPKRWVRIS